MGVVVVSVKRFSAEWAEYRELVIPKGASPLQVDETHRAFYAGGLALFALLVSSMEAGAEPTEADVAAVDVLHEELLAGCAEHVGRDGERTDPRRRPS